jgi:hypothetical protein
LLGRRPAQEGNLAFTLACRSAVRFGLNPRHSTHSDDASFPDDVITVEFIPSHRWHHVRSSSNHGATRAAASPNPRAHQIKARASAVRTIRSQPRFHLEEPGAEIVEFIAGFLFSFLLKSLGNLRCLMGVDASSLAVPNVEGSGVG